MFEPTPTAHTIRSARAVMDDLGSGHGVGVVAIAAAEIAALEARRLRLHHLRGASGIGYEADVVVMLNEKASAVSAVHSAYDPVGLEAFRKMVVVSIDKNRRGRHRSRWSSTRTWSTSASTPLAAT